MYLLQKNKEVMIRMGIYGLFMAMNALSSFDVINALPFDQTQLIYTLALELVSILILRWFPDSSLTRDCIDISLYTLLYKAVILEACFFNADLYNWLWAYAERPLMAFLFLTALIRICWVQPTTVGLDFVAWPSIGPSSWTAAKKVNSGHSWVPLLAIMLCASFACVLVQSKFPFTKLLAGGCGLFTLFFCIRSITRNLAAVETEVEAREQLIRDYEEELLRLSTHKAEHAVGNSKPNLTLVVDNDSSSDKADRNLP
jgi:hypothetical protein